MESVKHKNHELQVRLRRSSSSPYAAFVAYNEGGAVMGVDPIPGLDLASLSLFKMGPDLIVKNWLTRGPCKWPGINGWLFFFTPTV